MTNKFIFFTAVLVIVCGLLVLAGWVFDISSFKSVLPIWVSMKANTAICFVLIGISLLFVALPKILNSKWLQIGRFCSLLVGLIALLTLSEYLFSWDLGIDTALFTEPAGTIGTSYPGRMAPETALCFILLAFALWLSNVSTGRCGDGLMNIGLLVLMLTLPTIVTYFTPNLNMSGWLDFTIMAIHTTVLFVVLAVAVITIGWQRSHHLSDKNSTFQRNNIKLDVGMAVIILVIVTAVLLILSHLRKVGENKTVVVTQNMAQVLDMSVEVMIDKIALSIQANADEISREIFLLNQVDSQVIRQHFKEQKSRLPETDNLYSFNEFGDVIYNTEVPSKPFNVSNLEHFIKLRDTKNVNLVTTTTLVNRSQNDWISLVACRINKPDGSFGGIVSATILLDKINGVFSRIELNADDSIALRDNKLAIIARYPATTASNVAIGNNKISIPFAETLKLNPYAGTYISGVTSIDNISRIHSYRKNVKYGFIINVGIAAQSALTEWRKQVWVIIGLVIIFTMTLLAFSRMIKRAWLQQEQDITSLKVAEIEIKQLNSNLEKRVQQRTNELETVNQSLIVAKVAAEKANVAKSTFIATMSHELRTPLNAILGFSELMSLDTTATSKQKETLGIINRSGAHLLSMINDVLDISKIEAGRLELDIQALDLVEFLNDISVMVNTRMKAKQLDFHLELAPDITQFIKTDSGKLRQVLINLLGNAIKFTAKGTIILRAKMEALILTIEVIDSGIGIPTDKQSELFKPFVQVMQANSDTQGTGLGLAISKSLIELMGGQISMSSKFDVGSTFKIELPITLAVVNDVITNDDVKVVKSLAPNQPAWRLLVVDDTADNRLLLASMLIGMGFEVREAKNGREAIQAFEQWQPHLIWMDMRMPEVNGFEATAKIRQLEGGDNVKILALTASVFKEQHQRILESGCDAVLHKPIHVSEIFAALAKYLGVKFIYDDAPTLPTPVTKMTIEMMSQLPVDLREQLHNAALLLDTEKTDLVITQIYTILPDVADALKELAKNYQFDQIIQLIVAVNVDS